MSFSFFYENKVKFLLLVKIDRHFLGSSDKGKRLKGYGTFTQHAMRKIVLLVFSKDTLLKKLLKEMLSKAIRYINTLERTK